MKPKILEIAKFLKLTLVNIYLTFPLEMFVVTNHFELHHKQQI